MEVKAFPSLGFSEEGEKDDWKMMRRKGFLQGGLDKGSKEEGAGMLETTWLYQRKKKRGLGFIVNFRKAVSSR